MDVEWSYASLVGSVGFVMVFAILMILLFCIWATGRILFKMNIDQPVDDTEKDLQGPNAGHSEG